MNDKKTIDENLSFETAMIRLEQIVRALEEGKITLDDSLKLYEEGIALVRLCSGKLDEAEQKIKIIRTSSTGEKYEEELAN